MMNSSTLNITTPNTLPPLDTSLSACNLSSDPSDNVFNTSAIPDGSTFCQINFPYPITNMVDCCTGPACISNNCTQWRQMDFTMGQDSVFPQCVEGKIRDMRYD
ncbi:hypothetical protein Vi05172_g11741 [Venturia inaequalis]|nr:hypothetical protein Vi05172_g11741 [Venturia inaequalis]